MKEHTIYLWHAGELTRRTIHLPPEIQLTLQVNGTQLLRIAASPTQQEALVVGYLYYSGIIRARDEIEVLHINNGGSCADVWLTHALPRESQTPLLTSGCGMGVVLGSLYAPAAPLAHNYRLEPEALLQMMTALQAEAGLYHETQGVHTSGLFTPQGTLLALAEDIGRHNTLDKLLGLCLLKDIDSDGAILLTTGRVSSEMLSKAAKMGTPIVGSLTALSSAAIQMAEEWQITGVGYIRGRRMRFYTHPQRLIDLPDA